MFNYDYVASKYSTVNDAVQGNRTKKVNTFGKLEGKFISNSAQ
jgi:hypothetical protein